MAKKEDDTEYRMTPALREFFKHCKAHGIDNREAYSRMCEGGFEDAFSPWNLWRQAYNAGWAAGKKFMVDVAQQLHDAANDPD